ncbi:MAG: MerR family transcriptional regulator [Candidatus Sericytochromatia bacterium]|nr:MerR family transcriptional regulator [Candidatus Sericytochromatia bacterium]
MSNDRLSTPEASKALGIPVHVISYWLGQIPYPAEQDENGEWRLTPEALSVLQTVKELKEQNHSMETIRRMVRELVDTPPPPPPSPERPSSRHSASSPAPRLEKPAARSAPLESPLPRVESPSGGAPTTQAPAAQAESTASAAASRKPAAPRQQTAAVPQKSPAPLAPPTIPAGDAGAIASYVARAVAEAVRQETVLSHRYAHAAHQIGKLEAENEHLRTMLNNAQRRHQREMEDARQRIADLQDRQPERKGWGAWWTWLAAIALL